MEQSDNAHSVAVGDKQLQSGLLQHLRESGTPQEVSALTKIFERPFVEIEHELEFLAKANLVRYERTGTDWGWVLIEVS